MTISASRCVDPLSSRWLHLCCRSNTASVGRSH